MTNTLICNIWGMDIPVAFITDSYKNNNNLYIGIMAEREHQMIDWCDLTINLSTRCVDDCSYIDINNLPDGIIDWLVSNNLGTPTGRKRASGWCYYPEFKFNMDELSKYIYKEENE